MSLSYPPRYHLPTHLDTPDTIDLPLFGITVSVTIRQGLLALFGGSLVFHLWENSLGLRGLFGVVHWVGPVLLAFLTYILATQKVRGRYLEHWTLVLSRYLSLPNVFVWCREQPLIPPETGSHTGEREEDTYEEQEAQ